MIHSMLVLLPRLFDKLNPHSRSRTHYEFSKKDTMSRFNLSFNSHPSKIISLKVDSYLPNFGLVYRICILSFIFGPAICAYPLHLIHRQFDASSSWYIKLLVRQLESAGPLYIKLGQWASTRRDLFSDRNCDALSSLQNCITAQPWKSTRDTIESELGCEIEKVFKLFECIPVGVGAVAQVHRAVLRESGKVVAVKVMHPTIHQRIESDLEIVKMVGSLIELVPGFTYLGPRKEIDSFCAMMMTQLDLRLEAENLERFNFNFKDHQSLRFPVPISNLCSKNVLVETFHDGILLKDWLVYGSSLFDSEIAYIGLNGFMKMLLKDNFAHADLHAGNVILTLQKIEPAKFMTQSVITPLPLNDLESLKTCTTRQEWIERLEHYASQGYTPQLTLVDVGLVSVLNPQSLSNFTNVVQAALQFDGKKIAELLIQRSTHPDLVIDHKLAEITMSNLIDSVKLDEQGRLPISKIYSSNIMHHFTNFLKRHRIHLEGDFVGICVACLLIEGIGRKLDSNLDLMDSVAEYS